MADEEGPLAGSVKYYEQQIAVCTGGPPELWAARVEEMEGLFAALNEALRARGLHRTIKLTACDVASTGAEGFDLLLLPDMLVLPEVTVDRVAALADALAHRFERGLPFDVAPMAGGDHIFVCTHANRDARCGAWGEPFHAALTREVEATGAIAHVHRTSHIGGHRFAATCIVYPQGVWYGNLRPEDAPRLVSDHLDQEMLLPDHYRGRLGVPPAQQVAEAAAARGLLRETGRYDSLVVTVKAQDRRAEALARGWLREGGRVQQYETTFLLRFARAWWEVEEEVRFSRST